MKQNRLTKVKRLKVSTFIYRHLYGTWPCRSSLQLEVAYWPAMTLGGAAQVAAAHYRNEQTLDPAVCSYNRPMPCPSQPHYGLHPTMFSGNDSLFLVASITRY